MDNLQSAIEIISTSTLVELKYLLYVCRTTSQTVEDETIQNRGTTHESLMVTRQGIHERSDRAIP